MEKIKNLIIEPKDCYIEVGETRQYILPFSQRKLPVTPETQVITIAEMARKIEELITVVNILIENK